MTTEFKVGDRVRRIKYDFGGIRVGDEGTIEEIKQPFFPGDKSTIVLKEYDFKCGFTYDNFELVTNKEEIVSDLYDLDGNSITLDAYNPALLPLFTKLAEEAERRGYCDEYDRVAAVAGVPSRAEINGLNTPPVPTHGIEAFEALEIGDEFKMVKTGYSQETPRYKTSPTEYLQINPGVSRVLTAAHVLDSDTEIEKVTR